MAEPEKFDLYKHKHQCLLRCIRRHPVFVLFNVNRLIQLSRFVSMHSMNLSVQDATNELHSLHGVFSPVVNPSRICNMFAYQQNHPAANEMI